MARGHYTFEQIRAMSSLEIYYLYHYQELALKEQQQYLSNILGVVWDREVLLRQMGSGSGGGSGKSSEPLRELFIPLSVAIAPNVMDFVKEQFGIDGSGSAGVDGAEKNPYIAGGEYIPKKGEVIRSMSSLSKEEFMQFLGRKR